MSLLCVLIIIQLTTQVSMDLFLLHIQLNSKNLRNYNNNIFMTTLKICLKHLTVCQNFLSSLMLKNCTGSLRNENSFCLLLTWLVAQLLYTQCVIRIQGEMTALVPSSRSKRRVISRSHNAPWPWSTSRHSSHCYPTGYKPGHRAQNLQFIIQVHLC